MQLREDGVVMCLSDEHLELLGQSPESLKPGDYFDVDGYSVDEQLSRDVAGRRRRGRGD